jgi:hypothetical protein
MNSDPEVRDLLDEYNTLATDRKPFEAVWDEIDANLLPNVSRLAENANKSMQGKRGDEAIVDGGPRSALTTFQAGLMGRLMSSTFDWLAVETPDEDMMDDRETRMWLSKVNQAIFSLVNRSWFYPVVYALFGIAGGLGTGTIYREFDKNVGKEMFSIRNTWEMYFADDPNGENDTAIRHTVLTNKQMAQQFRDDNLDPEVERRAANSSEQYNDAHLIHVVKPNPNYDPRKRDKLNKRFSSWYIDLDHERLLRKGGYSVMPYSTWRIEKEVNEAYGRGPGWRALADIKALYAYARTDITAAQFNSNPAYDIPEERRGQVKIVPGGRNYYEDAAREIKQLSKPDPRFGLEREQHKQQIIDRHFMVPFFTAMQQIGSMDRQRTAYEVRQIEQEAAILLGPYATGFQVQFMDRIVEGLFYDAMENGMIPAPPMQLVQNLNGAKLAVRYSGPLAQAQKSFFNTEPYRRTIQDITALMSMDPTGQSTPRQIFDIPDWDRFFREMAQGNGLPEEAMFEARRILANRDARAKKVEQQQQLNQMEQIGKAMPGLNQPVQPGSAADALAKQAKGQPVAAGQQN